MEHDEKLNVTEYDAKINFKRNKKNIAFKLIVKCIVFVIIAVFTGYLTASKVIDSKRNELDDKIKNVTRYFPRGEEKGNPILTKETVIQVIEKMGASIVAVSGTNSSAFNDQDTNCSSGIIFDKKGNIITSYHSLINKKQLFVKKSGKIYSARYIGGDQLTDIAVIRVDGLQNLTPARFANYNLAKVGQYNIAISNPYDEEYNGNASLGIIYGINKRFQFSETCFNVLMTDANVNLVNGGGVICDTDAQIMGVTSLKITHNSNQDFDDYQKQGIYFALSGENVSKIANELIKNGKVERTTMGISGTTEYGKSKDDIITDSILGIRIKEIISGSGAANAGIQVGDILEEIDNKKITRIDDVSEILETHNVNDIVSCKIVRQNQTTKENQAMKLNVTLSELK